MPVAAIGLAILSSLHASAQQTATGGTNRSDPAELIAILQGQLGRCWNPPDIAGSATVSFQLDSRGAVIGHPLILSGDRSVGTSAVYAVETCATRS